jgi:DNA-binding NarL/FixJ family response regulator
LHHDAPKKFRILIADDCESMRRAISRLASTRGEIIGSVGNGQAAVDAVLELRPDLIVLDILMPVLDGIQVLRRLRAAGSSCRVLMLTGLEDKDFASAALQAGANGFVFKSRMGTDLLHAIEEVLAGHTFVSPAAPRHDDRFP